jgi:hypothetical protein
MAVCGIKGFLEILGPILGLLAAAAWITSAWYGKLPLTYQSIETTMVQQSRWNAYAAILAALKASIGTSGEHSACDINLVCDGCFYLLSVVQALLVGLDRQGTCIRRLIRDQFYFCLPNNKLGRKCRANGRHVSLLGCDTFSRSHSRFAKIFGKSRNDVMFSGNGLRRLTHAVARLA